MVVGVLALDIDVLVLQDEWHQSVPGNEGEVGIRDLVANERLLALESAIQDTDHALHLLDVSLSGRWNLLLVEVSEPGSLAIVWSLTYCLSVNGRVLQDRTLTAHLEMQPLLEQVLLWGLTVGELRIPVSLSLGRRNGKMLRRSLIQDLREQEYLPFLPCRTGRQGTR